MDILLAIIGAGSAGSFLAIGSAANARLKQTLHSPIAAAAINFVVGFSILALLIALGLFQSPDWQRFTTTPWWAFLGGFLGAAFVSLSTVTVPKLGLTTATLAVVCSQMMMSLVIDQFGWFGVPSHTLDGSRVFAIALLIVAIALTQLDRQHSNSI
ncbi:DMT family transporter [Oscillatoria sp. FACHB-1407]|uniref:DMT family transporter n=1 Tax=Oscillatoria sp. FACHB-1407 TaxID=2692847 RepID=UPI00168265BC|nr:DMT family transporter [Oscillatoria sp. FACHB-1407]MBD2464489.1 DMT family transporter [Oscillatoria sp. FACHB-1407]